MKWLGERHKWVVILGTVVALAVSVAVAGMPSGLVWWPATGAAVERYDLQFSTAELSARYVVVLGSAGAGIFGAALAIIAATRTGFGRASVPVAFVAALLAVLHLLLPLMHLAITS
ncbi:MAG: hypothetical protein GF393_00590 [Armatimonadia bacterium]|nr:hypothetical protein [Armatimonadia bacterium]